MAGQRQAKDTDLILQPGVVTNLTDRDARGRWKDSNRIRWHKGLPEKLGGWVRQLLTGANNGIYIGVARALHDWSSLDTQQWISIGTNCKLYLINNGTLFDITPLRKASNTTNSLSVTMGSPIITVTDIDHRASDGDHVNITASLPIGGFVVSGTFDIASIIDPDTYTVTFTSNFSNNEVGGGDVTIEYDISCGLEENGELLGYGTGEYGMGTFGTPRPVGSGVPARARTWSLDNWGEDLVSSYSDGEFFWWDKTTGPNSRAVLIPEAPTDIQRMLVNPENRHAIAIGCSGLDGVADPMLIRWCSQGDFSDWIPTKENTAGDKRLDYGSRMITGIKSRSQNYLWSDTQMYTMQYVGPDFIFVFDPKGACKIVGPNAAVDVNGTAYFMAFDDFFIYDGTLRVMDCDVHTRIFGDEDRNVEGDFDRTQATTVYCASYMPKNEVTWYYLATTGVIRYVTYNYAVNCWYYGAMQRTAFHDVSEAITGYKTNPYGVNGGYLYKHEAGTDEIEGEEINPQDWFLESYDNNVGGSDAVMLINRIIPNFDRLSGSMRMLLRKKSKPRQALYQERGPYLIEEDTLELGVRCKASQIALRLYSNQELGEDFRMGVFQVQATPYGGRVGNETGVAPSPPGPVVLAAEWFGPDAPPALPVILDAALLNYAGVIPYYGYNTIHGTSDPYMAANWGDFSETEVLDIYTLISLVYAPDTDQGMYFALQGATLPPNDAFVSLSWTDDGDVERTLLATDATILLIDGGVGAGVVKVWRWQNATGNWPFPTNAGFTENSYEITIA